MSILTVSLLEKSFGTDLLFTDVTFSIAAGQKMGLVGRNGCGKTTLLRILLGQEQADTGKVSLAAGRRLGYLRQEAPVHPEHTLMEEILTVFAPLRVLEAKMQTLEQTMETAQTDEALEQTMNEYSEVRDEFDVAGGYHYAADLDFVLEKLGFSEADHEKLVGSCSGGEQTRLALAKIVLSKPDLLILDEPTNHLDINAVEWLEGFLKSYEGAVIMVSHDRYFLDAVVDTIADVENQRLTAYRGNYSHFRRQKEEQFDRQQALFEQQQLEKARLEDLIKRNMGGNATQSKIRNKTRGRIERMEVVNRPTTDTSTMRTRFDADGAGRIGREVLRAEGVAKTFGERTLFSDLDFLIERGDRVGFVGPNGAGKTTLVRMILGTEQPTRGGLTLGHNVRLSYFSQHAADSLLPGSSVLSNIQDTGDMTETEARNYLARFLFVGDDVYKTIGMLSGGEKNKLALARMILEPCNLLILDEPTNHLDIASCESLTEMLSNYDGTLMLVSHDRYLLNATTTKTLALSGSGSATLFEGNYAAWREATRNAPISKNGKHSPATPSKVPSSGGVRDNPPAANAGGARESRASGGPEMNSRELSKARVKAREAVLSTEEAVHHLEERIAEVESRLAVPSGSVGDMVAIAAEHTRLQDDLAAALTAWERALASSEALGG
jgi:ATP-binding cassette subfamily F protein 3